MHGSMGKWQDGVWARRGTQRRRSDLGTGQGGVEGSEMGANGRGEQGQQTGLWLDVPCSLNWYVDALTSSALGSNTVRGSHEGENQVCWEKCPS